MASSLESEDLNKTVSKIRTDILCQICENGPRPGKTLWYRCLKLHQICIECHGKNKKCSCGELVSKEHCKIIEDLLNIKGLKVQVSCKNKKNGCQDTFSENALEDHECGCIYRVVPCPKTALGLECKAKVLVQNVIQHFEETHFKIGSCSPHKNERHCHRFESLNENGSKGINCYFFPLKIEIDGKSFILAGKVKDKIYHRWVYIIGSPEEAKHFSFVFKLFGKNASAASTLFEGKVAAIDESFDTLMNAGKCFTIGHQAFMAQSVDKDLKFEYSVE
eukprot:07793.XXX_406053_406880_1 [CDS] Oithona nana genome sequencing.